MTKTKRIAIMEAGKLALERRGNGDSNRGQGLVEPSLKRAREQMRRKSGPISNTDMGINIKFVIIYVLNIHIYYILVYKIDGVSLIFRRYTCGNILIRTSAKKRGFCSRSACRAGCHPCFADALPPNYYWHRLVGVGLCLRLSTMQARVDLQPRYVLGVHRIFRFQEISNSCSPPHSLLSDPSSRLQQLTPAMYLVAPYPLESLLLLSVVVPALVFESVRRREQYRILRSSLHSRDLNY